MSKLRLKTHATLHFTGLSTPRSPVGVEMRKLILACLLLSGCAYTHVPKMETPPKDQAKFDADTKLCRDKAFERGRVALDKSNTVTGFGLLGSLVTAPDSEKNPDYYKTPMTMTDECMVELGYPVIQ